MMNKKIVLTASFLGLIAVILGAFGTHGLEDKISERHQDTWDTAVEYQFYHTFAILFLSTFSRANNSYINFSFYSFLIGIVFFCGSLYLLSTNSLTGFVNPSLVGPITPLGGLFFILGWASFFVATFRFK